MLSCGPPRESSWADEYHASVGNCRCGKKLGHGEHACVRCGHWEPIVNLGRCRNCEDWFRKKEAREWDVC